MQRRTSKTERSENRGDYHAAFVRCVHQLLECGYQRMQPVNRFEYRKEEEISGELARHIDEVLNERAESWMHYYSLAPERHVDEPHLPLAKQRLGKRRKRLDFQFTCRPRKPTPVQRFIFESKSLKQSSAAQLLDEDGLGRILCGQYAREDISAGLLGYVQNFTVAHHAAALENELKGKPADYGITPDGQWTRIRFAKGPAETFRTKHRRGQFPKIAIFTTLLPFR